MNSAISGIVAEQATRLRFRESRIEGMSWLRSAAATSTPAGLHFPSFHAPPTASSAALPRHPISLAVLTAIDPALVGAIISARSTNLFVTIHGPFGNAAPHDRYSCGLSPPPPSARGIPLFPHLHHRRCSFPRIGWDSQSAAC